MTDNTSTPENKTEPEFTEWTLEGFLEEVKDIHDNMKDRAFVFILGAGASVTSGIPAGGHFADKWLTELYKRRCSDASVTKEQWAKDNIDKDFNITNSAQYYSDIFEQRFHGDWEAGYVGLENAMEKATPSFGYFMLAHILANTDHKAVVTTNFDNLVAHALSALDENQPLIVGHEGLSAFARPNRKRPLIAKIHRDLLLNPSSDIRGTSELGDGWKDALQRLFSHYTPIVIGYGGNDKSLMNFLKNGDLKIPGRIFWCYRGNEKPNMLIQETVAKHKGIFVNIAGFDELMIELCNALFDEFNYLDLIEKIKSNAEAKIKDYEKKAESLINKETQGNKLENSLRITSEEINTEKAAISNSILFASIAKNPDIAEQRYLKELQLNPEKPSVYESYARFLINQKKDYKQAEEMYQKALALAPNNANITNNYANFLGSLKKDYEQAEKMYQKALKLDPENASITGNYANFLGDETKDYEQAETMFQKALELNPKNASITGNYANFLADETKNYEKAEEMYQKALELDPENVRITGNYAIFLKNQRKNHLQAEKMFQTALKLDPENAWITGTYANFLANSKKEYAEAEKMYQTALKLDPENARITGSYANFLADKKKDYVEAEKMYQTAMRLDPENVQITGNYADFLTDQKKDYAEAEKMFQKTMQLDPENAWIIGNYADFLAHKKNDTAEAEKMYQAALKLDPENAHITGNYAIFLDDQKKDCEHAEKMFQKAIQLDPTNPNITSNYAAFLENQKKDTAETEIMYQKALELDPENAWVTGNYADFIANFCYQILEQSTVENPPQFQERIQKVIELSAKIKTQSLAEALIYRALGDELTNQPATESLSMLKFAIQQSYEREEWDFSAMFAVVLPRIAERKRAFYEALGAAILDETKVADLDAFDDWVQLPAISPFGSV